MKKWILMVLLPVALYAADASRYTYDENHVRYELVSSPPGKLAGAYR